MKGPKYKVADRRPIASRDTRGAQTIAKRLAAAGVAPNAISVFGMVAAIGAGLLFGLTGEAEFGLRWLWLGGAALVQLRLLCNLFDGMVAVEREIASPLGELYNEVPDRISDVAVLIGVGYAAGGAPTLGCVAAMVALFVAYVRAMDKVAGAPNDFCGPMAKAHRMAVVTVLGLYIAASPATWRLDWGPGGAWAEAAVALWIIIAGGVLTAIRRLRRAGRALREAPP